MHTSPQHVCKLRIVINLAGKTKLSAVLSHLPAQKEMVPAIAIGRIGKIVGRVVLYIIRNEWQNLASHPRA